MMASHKLELSHFADLTPAPQERLWHSAPHPRLPIAATCGADKMIRIYSLLNFTLISSISGGHKRSVRSSAWKPNSREETVLATASFDATVGIWKRWDDFKDTSMGVAHSSMLEDGNMDKYSAPEGENEESEDWTFAVLLDGHDSEVKGVSWSSSGSFLATCSRDKSIWIWEDLEDGESNFETIAVLQDHQGDVKCVSWHPEDDCLASGSYDNTIRLWKEDIDDWSQAACLSGHEGTVWAVDWEAPSRSRTDSDNHNKNGALDLPTIPNTGGESTLAQGVKPCAPRLVSCSDDKTIRIWRKLSDQALTDTQTSNNSIPGTIRTNSIDETWVQESILPVEHDLSIYSVAWSKRTGLLASTGADGKIVIYAERPKSSQKDLKPSLHDHLNQPPINTGEDGGIDAIPTENTHDVDIHTPETEWHILSTVEAAHGIHEINHVCWAKRADIHRSPSFKPGEQIPRMQEEILLSTGDNGIVRVWEIVEK
ncbi:WD repeat protein [Arthroderma uncinatum]|uniref:WD repeat protein n=1 Tax=Arthroderma uncinatum TaxID=74035 RepID=UPI00144AA0B1|nr:WD repeat protein [Arthroderma uncinatum]KAF3492086.1 WD repeat protein [Arthroderma uncinatum]